MEERRSARVGTVSGLALLAGGTAVAAVAGGAHSVFATVLLCLLTICLGHSLKVEIRRQAHRRSAGGWARQDTLNAVLLGVWAELTLIAGIIETGPMSVRAVCLALSLGYASSCGYFVTERRRAVAELFGSGQPAQPSNDPDQLERVPEGRGAELSK
ncbi:MAG TPA: hypothetical protein VGB74_01085 [Actinoplanes sp.]